MNLGDLYKYAEDNGVIITCGRTARKKAFCVSAGEIRAIKMDLAKLCGEREERCVLAEELAHLKYNLTYYLSDIKNPVARIAASAAEYRAGLWAAELLIPLDALKEALNKGFTEAYELAEHFDVSEDTVKKAFEQYYTHGLL